MMHEILVCGGRDFQDSEYLFKMLDIALRLHPDMVVISGAARGADTLAVEWAKSRGVPFKEFPAEWAKHGRSAGPKRNQKMLDENNVKLVLAFKGGSGTVDMVRRATQAGIMVYKVGGWMS